MRVNYSSVRISLFTLTNLMLIGILFLPTTEIKGNTKIKTYQLTGYAYDIKTGKYVYEERHTEYYQNSKHLYSIVSYVDSKGKEFANKRIDFQVSPTAPDFKTTDLRTGYIEGAKKNDSKSYNLFSKLDENSPLSSKTIKINSSTVIDGGFDYFIRKNRKNLQDGKVLSIEFPVASRTTTFKFNIKKSKTTVYNDQDVHQIVMSINNRFLGLLVEPISVYYDVKTWRLLAYKGLSNITDDKGDGYKVNIIYKYNPGDPIAENSESIQPNGEFNAKL